MTNPLHAFQATRYKSTCGGITPEKVQQAADSEPGLAAKLEAVMMLGRGVTDGAGTMLPTQICPALALAVIRVVEAKVITPQEAAYRILMGRP